MNQSPVVSPESLPTIVYSGVKVITTELLAQAYGSEPKRITNNYQRNKSRFIEGRHFHRVSGRELSDLRTSLRGVQISSKTRTLSLWTERGAARHAKMLETNQAWDVFEQLEDSYFSAKAREDEGSDLSTVSDRVPLYFFTVDTVIRHRLLFSKVYLLLNLFAGSKRFKEMTREQVDEVASFCDRFAIGLDTRADWQRIKANQQRLHGEPKQLDFISELLEIENAPEVESSEASISKTPITVKESDND